MVLHPVSEKRTFRILCIVRDHRTFRRTASPSFSKKKNILVGRAHANRSKEANVTTRNTFRLVTFWDEYLDTFPFLYHPQIAKYLIQSYSL